MNNGFCNVLPQDTAFFDLKKGDDIGIKVKDRVRPHDVVYKVK